MLRKGHIYILEPIFSLTILIDIYEILVIRFKYGIYFLIHSIKLVKRSYT